MRVPLGGECFHTNFFPPGIAAINAWLETSVRAALFGFAPPRFDVLRLHCGLLGFCERAEVPGILPFTMDDGPDDLRPTWGIV